MNTSQKRLKVKVSGVGFQVSAPTLAANVQSDLRKKLNEVSYKRIRG